MMMNKKKSYLRKLANCLSVLPLILLLITANSLYAQTKETQQEAVPPQEPKKKENKSNEIFIVVENQPEYPGGVEAMEKFLSENIRYPIEAMKKGVQGRVITKFIINKDGSLSDIDIVRGVDSLLDAEAIRVIGMMPKWKPGTQKDKAVNVEFTLPVVFRLTNDDTATKSSEEKSRNRKPIFILNDVKMGEGFDLSQIKPEDRKSISVLNNGIIRIVTKSKSAETKIIDYEPDERFMLMDNQPQFPGGIDAMTSFLSENVRYPSESMEKGNQGRVMSSFFVDKEGSISNIQVVRGVDPLIDAEAIRLISTMPDWVPAFHEGEPVNARFTIGINFLMSKNLTGELERFLGENIKYPVFAQENGIMGVVRATYDVNDKGKISNIIITESAHPSLDAELVRVTKLIPNVIAWIKTGGKAASKVEISALFRLQNGSTPTTAPVESDVVVVGYGKPVSDK